MLECFNRALSRERPITLKRAVAAAGQIADGDPYEFITQSLWNSFEGGHFTTDQMFMKMIVVSRPELLNLIQMTTLADFLNANPNIKPHGDTLAIMEWEFSPKALNPKSLRVPGTLLQTSRSRKTQAIQHYGVGFIMPSDWPMDKTKVAYYEKSLKALSESVVLSLNYNLVEKLKLEAVRRLVDTDYKLPLRDLRALSNMLEARYAQTFSVNKDGVGITGVEVQCVSKLRDLGKEPDMVLLTNEVYRFAHTIKAENRLLPKFGNQETKLPTYDRTNQSVVMLRTTHGLDAVPSRSYQVGRRDPVDPTTTPCYVSERFVMLPLRYTGASDYRDYMTSHRTIGIVNGEQGELHYLTLKRVLRECGLFDTVGGLLTGPGRELLRLILGTGGGGGGDGGRRRRPGAGGGGGGHGGGGGGGQGDGGGADEFNLGTLYEKAGMRSIITGLILDRPHTWEQLRAQSGYGLARRADAEGKHPTSRVRLGVFARGQLTRGELNAAGDWGEISRLLLPIEGALHVDDEIKYTLLPQHYQRVLAQAVRSFLDYSPAEAAQVIELLNQGGDVKCMEAEALVGQKLVPIRDNPQEMTRAWLECVRAEDRKELEGDEEKALLRIVAASVAVGVYMRKSNYRVPPSLRDVLFGAWGIQQGAGDWNVGNALGDEVDRKQPTFVALSQLLSPKDNKQDLSTLKTLGRLFPKDALRALPENPRRIQFLQKMDNWAREPNTNPHDRLQREIYYRFAISSAVQAWEALPDDLREGGTHSETGDTVQGREHSLVQEAIVSAVAQQGAEGSDGKSDRPQPAPVFAWLQATPVTLFCLEQLLDLDLPVPLGFVLFRPRVLFVGGSALFMRQGGSTCSVVCKDSEVIFANDPDSFQTAVQVRFKAGTVVTDHRTLRFAPNIVSVRYESGGGVRIARLQAHAGRVAPDEWDLLAVPVPYDYSPPHWFSSMTGTFSSGLLGTNTADDPCAEIFQYACERVGYEVEALKEAQTSLFTEHGLLKPKAHEQSICSRGAQYTYSVAQRRLVDEAKADSMLRWPLQSLTEYEVSFEGLGQPETLALVPGLFIAAGDALQAGKCRGAEGLSQLGQSDLSKVRLRRSRPLPVAKLYTALACWDKLGLSNSLREAGVTKEICSSAVKVSKIIVFGRGEYLMKELRIPLRRHIPVVRFSVSDELARAVPGVDIDEGALSVVQLVRDAGSATDFWLNNLQQHTPRIQGAIQALYQRFEDKRGSAPRRLDALLEDFRRDPAETCSSLGAFLCWPAFWDRLLLGLTTEDRLLKRPAALAKARDMKAEIIAYVILWFLEQRGATPEPRALSPPWPGAAAAGPGGLSPPWPDAELPAPPSPPPRPAEYRAVREASPPPALSPPSVPAPPTWPRPRPSPPSATVRPVTRPPAPAAGPGARPSPTPLRRSWLRRAGQVQQAALVERPAGAGRAPSGRTAPAPVERSAGGGLPVRGTPAPAERPAAAGGAPPVERPAAPLRGGRVAEGQTGAGPREVGGSGAPAASASSSNGGNLVWLPGLEEAVAQRDNGRRPSAGSQGRRGPPPVPPRPAPVPGLRAPAPAPARRPPPAARTHRPPSTPPPAPARQPPLAARTHRPPSTPPPASLPSSAPRAPAPAPARRPPPCSQDPPPTLDSSACVLAELRLPHPGTGTGGSPFLKPLQKNDPVTGSYSVSQTATILQRQACPGLEIIIGW
eukprot:g8482.t1